MAKQVSGKRSAPAVVEHPIRERAETASKAVAKTAVTAGRVVGKTSVRIAKPLVESLKHEDNKTLAKMVVAAITPRLINAGLRLAVRNPVLTTIGVLAVVATIGSQQDRT
jgi:hypothetical protein